jgi:beta-glucanase (GH16 family)
VARLRAGAVLGLAVLSLCAACGSSSPRSSPSPAVQQTSAVPATGRWVAGTVGLVDARGTRWSPDAPIATGGTVESSTADVAGTADAAIYQRSRVGVTSYRLPVARHGTYAVVLYLADLDHTAAGQGVFDVRVNGKRAVDGVDVAASVGQGRADHVLLTAIVKQDHLTVSFRARHGRAAVSAVTLSWVGAATTAATAFDDEFTGSAGSAVDPRWSFETGGNGWGNNELQSYTAGTGNASLDGAGNLAITARREAYTGTDGIPRAYTSAKLTTQKAVGLRYGRVEARIRMPAGSGLLPAFWALGDNHATVGWPESGEIDVAERPAANHAIFGSLHGPLAANPSTAYNLTNKTALSADPAGGFHVYAVDWYPGIVQFSVDGRVYATDTETDLTPGRTWVFDHPFYLLLNLAVGGNWPGSPPADETFPQQMLVDYVRVTS